MVEIWADKIDNLTGKFNSEFSSLSSSQLNVKPNANSWSIGQCIDHLIVTNEQYFTIIERINKGVYKSHWVSKVPFIPGLFGSVILKSVSPETIAKKTKTFTVFEPSESAIRADILSRFTTMQLQLKAYLSEISPANYTKIISSPVSRSIVYSLKTAIEIIIAHEERHFLQAKSVKEFVLNQS